MFNWPKLSNHFQKLQTQFEKLLQEDLGAKESEIQKVKSEFTIFALRAPSMATPCREEAEDRHE